MPHSSFFFQTNVNNVSLYKVNNETEERDLIYSFCWNLGFANNSKNELLFSGQELDSLPLCEHIK